MPIVCSAFQKQLVVCARLISAPLFYFVTLNSTLSITFAIWSIFGDIHSTRCINALFVATEISSYFWHTQCLPNLSYICNLRKDLAFQLLLALCRLLRLSKRKIIEASFTAFIGFTFTLPSALMHYLRSLLFVTRALFFCDTVICDRHNAYLMYPMIVISENTRSFNYSWHYVSLYVFQSKRLLKLLSLLSQDFLLL